MQPDSGEKMIMIASPCPAIEQRIIKYSKMCVSVCRKRV